MKYDLAKNKKRIKGMAPGTYECVLFIMSMAMLFLAFDFDLTYFGSFNAWVLLGVFCHGLFWLIDMIIWCCVKSYRKKKGLLDETED